MAMTASRGGGILTVGVGYKFRNNSMRKSEPKSALIGCSFRRKTTDTTRAAYRLAI